MNVYLKSVILQVSNVTMLWDLLHAFKISIGILF